MHETAKVQAAVSGLTRWSLFLLTVIAGWIDALCFLGLGKVFSSFMSGNFLFLGIAVGQRDWDFLYRASVALMAFLVGALTSTAIVSGKKFAGDRLSPVALTVEMFVLLAFAIAWHSFGEFGSDSVAQTTLLALASLGMGMQAASVFALGIPGVATNALTGTFTLIARIVSRKALGIPNPSGGVSLGYLLLLCVAYGCSAGVVVFSLGHKATIAVPVALLGVVILLALRRDPQDTTAKTQPPLPLNHPAEPARKRNHGKMPTSKQEAQIGEDKPNHKSLSEVLQAVAIIAAGIWGVYTFIYQEKIAPSLAPPSLSVTCVLEKTGQKDNMTAIRSTVTRTNVGQTKVRLLGITYNVIGIKEPLTGSGETNPEFNDSPPASGSFREARYYGKPEKREVILRVGNLFEGATALPSPPSDLYPGEALSRDIIFYVNQAQFDSIRFHVRLVYEKLSEPPIPLVLTIESDGLLTAKSDPACIKEQGHCRDLHTTDFTTELSLW